MQVLAPRRAGDVDQPYIPQYGTWNAAPITAAAGVATLALIQDGELVGAAKSNAVQLRAGLNDVLKHRGVPAVA